MPPQHTIGENRHPFSRPDATGGMGRGCLHGGGDACTGEGMLAQSISYHLPLQLLSKPGRYSLSPSNNPASECDEIAFLKRKNPLNFIHFAFVVSENLTFEILSTIARPFDTSGTVFSRLSSSAWYSVPCGDPVPKRQRLSKQTSSPSRLSFDWRNTRREKPKRSDGRRRATHSLFVRRSFVEVSSSCAIRIKTADSH